MISIAQEDLSGKNIYLLLLKEISDKFLQDIYDFFFVIIIFLADSSSHHQSWWKWMLMPQSFYSNSGGSRRTSYAPTTQYPFTSSYQYPRGSMNGYFSSYKPYNRNPSNLYYTR